jgi:hypothetical protein
MEQESRKMRRQVQGQQESNLKLQSKEVAASTNTPRSRICGYLNNSARLIVRRERSKRKKAEQEAYIKL